MDFLETIWILINCLDGLFTNPNGPIWARNPSLKVIQFGKVPWACLSYHWNAKALKVLGKIIFQFSSILALFAIHAIMNCIRWLLCFEPCHLINKDKGANWSIIWLPFDLQQWEFVVGFWVLPLEFLQYSIMKAMDYID